ncbi:hypothetical protein ARMSODRAFT_973488 [Armillaria solidipes]|uniref:Uncharacterized protein n=1 Tax=Armillaria solidipes TaxID=1076256 RepID=A0A2H3C0U9_9AGAR|nr:hypothetical protein ARMSODRAFT_973488 [Armillaria solidipes]
MSSLSGYDAVVVAAQQHDSASPPAVSKHVVYDAFQEWLHTLKALVADAPAQNMRLEFDSLESRLIQCEAVNQQRQTEFGSHAEQRMVMIKLLQYEQHFQTQTDCIATASNAIVRHSTPFALNIQARFIGTGEGSEVSSLLVKHVVSCNIGPGFGGIRSYSPKGLNDIGLLDAPPSYERYYTLGLCQVEFDLHCPLCNGPVDQKPQPLPIMESLRLLEAEYLSGKSVNSIRRVRETGPVYPEICRWASAINASGNIEAGRCLKRSVHHINPFDMASTDTIEQLASNLTAKLHDVNVPGVPAELGALLKEVRKSMRRQQRRFAAAREERLRATIRGLTLTEDQDVGEKILKLLLQHRRRLDQARREAEARFQRTQEHTNCLWVALKPV